MAAAAAAAMTTTTMRLALGEASLPTRPTVWLSSGPVLTGHLGGNGSHHGGDGKDGRDPLREWSSLIGIITAIVGNILIALALNVQRYAHTRLHKERNRMRRKARAALKRAQSQQEPGAYGTMPDEPEASHSNDRGSGGGNGNANDHFEPEDGLEHDPDRHDYQEDDPLTASFHSGSSMTRSDSEHDAARPTMTYLKSPYWWLGQILITLGEMGNFLAYGFAPASIVSPLGVVALISNCIIAPAMFHEKFRQQDFWGVVIAVSGVVTVVLSANQEETKLGPHDVWGAITAPEFEIYMGVTTALIIALMWASVLYGKRTLLIDLGLVGLFGGYTALSTKGVSSMLSSTLWGAFKTPVTYALLVVLLLTAIMQIRYVNKALQRFDSTQVIPIQFVMFTLCVIIGSAVLYRDFEKTTARQAERFVGGCLLTFFGVFLITTGRERKDDEEDFLSDTDGIEETIGLCQHDGTPSFAPYQDDVESRPRPPRRSSRLSHECFAEAMKPEVSRDGGIPHDANGPAVYKDQQTERSAIHPWPSPWDTASSSPLQSARASLPPRGVRTISADALTTRSVMGLAPIQSHSTTPPTRDLQLTPSHATDQPVTQRGHSHKSSVHHRSRPFISPSPLSSTVTTVVKDAFLREGDVSPSNRRRTIRSSIRASLYFDDDDDHAHDDRGDTATDATPVPTSDNDPSRMCGEGGTSRTRSRSLSDAIGDFFRPKRDGKEGGLSSGEGS